RTISAWALKAVKWHGDGCWCVVQAIPPTGAELLLELTVRGINCLPPVDTLQSRRQRRGRLSP
ncbi:MAG: hypothetical protein ABF291_03810, partial [Desulfobacterales bacterium]